MFETLHSKEVDEWPEDRQLEFYKEEFGYRQCNLPGCGHQVLGQWVIYKGYLYCEECYDWKKDEDYNKSRVEIYRLEAKIKEIKEKFGEDREGDVD